MVCTFSGTYSRIYCVQDGRPPGPQLAIWFDEPVHLCLYSAESRLGRSGFCVGFTVEVEGFRGEGFTRISCIELLGVVRVLGFGAGGVSGVWGIDDVAVQSPIDRTLAVISPWCFCTRDLMPLLPELWDSRPKAKTHMCKWQVRTSYSRTEQPRPNSKPYIVSKMPNSQTHTHNLLPPPQSLITAP